ncbi:PRKR-interacting protein 1 homolog [Punica granatum]|uniref:PRKR-interacting protein 1 homolog n=2 Tax=Punica granatum TaxID=22663 RepID=A0A6P8DKH3_PUNGR|nr:PRKR-interacting protein 1 homolog [Punica granatum]
MPPMSRGNPRDGTLEVKLHNTIENVPVRVSNTSDSSNGSNSSEFHKVRHMRRKEQDRLARMDVDYLKRKDMAEFIRSREERLKAAQDRTVQMRLKHQKIQRKRKKKSNVTSSEGGDNSKEEESFDDGAESNDANVTTS